MTVTETTDTTSVPGKIVKKFTTDLAPSTSQAQDSTTWTCPSWVTSVRCLIVGGGGSGASFYAGGGGAGGMIDTIIDVVPGTVYNIKIGAGGAASKVNIDPSNGAGRTGGNSEFNTTIANGGGGGGPGRGTAQNGGSGGGACFLDTPTLYGTGISGQGNNGGIGVGHTGGGGGGGAGSAGLAGDQGSTGGNGLQSDITGTNTYYAGGGGGARDDGGNSSGGLGGGGSGGYDSITAGTNGLGGGGGGIQHTSYYSGAGGSGVVILQYELPSILVRERQVQVNGSGNLLVMEVQT